MLGGAPTVHEVCHENRVRRPAGVAEAPVMLLSAPMSLSFQAMN